MDFMGLTDQVSWQDVVLTLGSVVFLLALVPTIAGSAKPAPLTSLSTGTVLILFSITYVTLDLRFASVVTGVTGLAWFLILWQSLRSGERLIRSGTIEDEAKTEGQ